MPDPVVSADPNDTGTVYDVPSMVDSVAGSLFPKAADAPVIDTPAGDAPAPGNQVAPDKPAPDTPPAPSIVPGQNSVGKAMPKSWKKEIEPLWAKLDPALHDYVYSREADVQRGLQQYQKGHTSWTELVQPFLPILEANPDVNPVQLMQGLLNTHLQLLNPAGDPAKKQELITGLLQSYGITLPTSGAPNTTVDPNIQIPPGVKAELDRVNRELAGFKQSREAEQRAAFTQQVAEETKRIEAFAADPANKYFMDVGNDILRLMKLDPSLELKDAYSTACWSNPTIREKMLADSQAKPGNGQSPRGKDGKFVNVDTTGDAPPRRTPKGSISDTIDGVISKHYSAAKH